VTRDSDVSSELVVVGRFLGTSLGEAEIEVAGWLGDFMRTRRLRAVVKTIGKTQKLLEEAGLEARSIPLKTLSPLLEGASYEDESDDDMIQMWANLLAQAAAGREDLPPGYIQALRELTPQQAQMLNVIASHGGAEYERYRKLNDTATYPGERSRSRAGAFGDLQRAPAGFSGRVAAANAGRSDRRMRGVESRRGRRRRWTLANQPR
jgi:hypothetical protein